MQIFGYSCDAIRDELAPFCKSILIEAAYWTRELNESEREWERQSVSRRRIEKVFEPYLCVAIFRAMPYNFVKLIDER